MERQEPGVLWLSSGLGKAVPSEFPSPGIMKGSHRGDPWDPRNYLYAQKPYGNCILLSLTNSNGFFLGDRIPNIHSSVYLSIIHSFIQQWSMNPGPAHVHQRP